MVPILEYPSVRVTYDHSLDYSEGSTRSPHSSSENINLRQLLDDLWSCLECQFEKVFRDKASTCRSIDNERLGSGQYEQI